MRGRILAASAAAAVLVGAGAAWADLTPEAGSPYATGPGPYGVYAADFNADGRPDLITANGDTGPPGTMTLYLRQAGGGFAEETSSPPYSGGTSTGAVGDFNGDGLPDIAIADYTGGTVAIRIRSAAGGGFTSETSPVGGFGFSDVAVADFNGDQRPDLAISSLGTNNVTIAVRNAANTGFDVLTNIAAGAGPRAVAAADFDGDGDNDVAVSDESGNDVMLLRNNGPGGFGQENPSGTPTGARPGDLVAADFNGDGRPDVAVVNRDANTVSVLLRNASNDGFTAGLGSPIAVSAGPSGIATADFDRNGQPDLIVASSSGFATVLRRSGDGFAADAPIALTGSPVAATTADFNLDGVPDAAVSSLGSNHVAVLLSPSPPAQPTPTPTPSPTPTPLDQPKSGEVNLLPVKGTVKVKLKGAKSYVDLKTGIQIPVGASVDARKGTVTIVGPGKDDKANFFDGLFKISQAKGLTTLTLTEALDCRTKAKTAAKKPKSRKLWGDGKGKFRTKGSYSAATVRGTKWLVKDTCTSTTTTVTQGVVQVEDFVKHVKKTVRKGKHYTARKKKR
ncbi:FG-GAP repeat domain-containing protein [Solirubrobacter soli]|uniref:FG-GAP repeat domain-containing protein n=1 Tax=Solirubrobacter soli TaxID=363832 RepID=UPI000418A203|nr:VCBS repeat-containing protein [Solirubrobacter soli]